MRRHIAVHGGVSFERSDMHARCREALHVAVASRARVAVASRADEECLGDVVVDAVANLESDPMFNAGVGSNLTRNGTVECEAAVMRTSSEKGIRFGAVGAVSRLCFPVRAAAALADSEEEAERGLIDPMVLVGEAAEVWAIQRGIEECAPAELITETSLGRLRSKLAKIVSAREHAEGGEEKTTKGNEDGDEEFIPAMDTVGGVEIFEEISVDGRVGVANEKPTGWVGVANATACVSSGGILLKRPGRLGHSTHFGAGIWSQRYEDRNSGWIRTVAVSCSGCGEAIIMANLARELADAVGNRPTEALAAQALSDTFKRLFDRQRSPLLAHFSSTHLYAGGIVLLSEREVDQPEVSPQLEVPPSLPEVNTQSEVSPQPEAPSLPQVNSQPEVSPQLEIQPQYPQDKPLVELLIFHNSPYLPVAYVDSNGKARKMMSRNSGNSLHIESVLLP